MDMSSTTQTATTQIRVRNATEVERIESVIADIEGLCGQVFCEGLFMNVNRDIMAIACERHPRVLDWWQTMVKLGHPKATVVWAEIKARMDSRAAARALDAVCRLRVV